VQHDVSEAKVPIGTLGLLSELTLAYKFKFVWAPFLDRYDAPLFSRLLGRRRGWIVVSQLAVAVALAGVAFGDPSQWLAWTVAFSLALGFAGATQDVVIDGWRITVAPAERQALMSSWAEVGWRVGNLAAGAGALYLADAYGWRAAYLCMAALMAPGMAAALLAPEPESDKTVHHEHPGFVVTVTTPIKELVTRLGPMAVPVLVMVAGFRMPGYVSSAMAVPLFKKPALFQLRHRHGHEVVRLRGGVGRHVPRKLRRPADRYIEPAWAVMGSQHRKMLVQDCEVCMQMPRSPRPAQ
jgi:MFS transporter, PAT family, beta-lactamase induction signal transducer AmpG